MRGPNDGDMRQINGVIDRKGIQLQCIRTLLRRDNIRTRMCICKLRRMQSALRVEDYFPWLATQYNIKQPIGTTIRNLNRSAWQIGLL
jgi:hypothetical protein